MAALPFWLPACFFVAAFFYAMVGFGGGSSYLALLVLAGVDYRAIAPTALICNVIVSAGGCWHFYKAGHLRPKIFLPFMLLSIPMAYLGGRIPIDKETFQILLGLALLTAAIRMCTPDKAFQQTQAVSWKKTWWIGLPAGAGLGFLSGLVGIGGGIFLSPLLLFMRWARVREAAAAASFFILLNSLAGMAGQMQKGNGETEIIIPLALVVFVGGQIGSRLGAYHVPVLRLKRLLAGLMFYVSIRLIGVI